MLLVGDFEGDVNNGGFSQYLLNKGRRTARAAQRALEAIGARRTAKLLDAALAKGVTDETLSKLDDRFLEVPENLAILVTRHAGR